ncbi:MAG: hypothetical protein H7Z39_16395 [Burkholderiaceae bacterium]|nr:hypothetical protein [Burkholderiaceae bacterium]
MARTAPEPDRAALEIAHRQLHTSRSLDDMLKVANLKATLYAVARRHMKRRERFDVRKMQANDND